MVCNNTVSSKFLSFKKFSNYFLNTSKFTSRKLGTRNSGDFFDALQSYFKNYSECIMKDHLRKN